MTVFRQEVKWEREGGLDRERSRTRTWDGPSATALYVDVLPSRLHLHCYNTMSVSHRLMKSYTHTCGLHAHLNTYTGNIKELHHVSRQVVKCKDLKSEYLDRPKVVFLQRTRQVEDDNILLVYTAL